MRHGTLRQASFALLLVACADRPLPSSPPRPAPQPPLAASIAIPAIAPVPESVAKLAEGAIIFDDLGSFHYAVTASSEAQRWFDQGLRLAYGFNHDEATRSFARGAVADPKCAMCYWGAALTMGPNYNMGMSPSAARPAWEALQRASQLASTATALEQALIGALSTRYKGPDAVESMDPFNTAYAAAMNAVAKQFLADDDVQVLAAEAAMDMHPWELWSLDGVPAPGTEWIVSTLETVLARNPHHPGANHYYIHAIEASPHPERALPSAEILAGLIPGAGHIAHMPAHIFQRVGRYSDASAANAQAIAVDLAYMKKVTPPGRYPMYLAHNYGFLSFSSSMEGRSAVAIEAARAAAKALGPSMRTMMRAMDFFAAEPILAMVRFGRWDDLLAEPKPDVNYPTSTAFWLHGHGMALAAKGKIEQARADLGALQKIADATPDGLEVSMNPAKTVYSLAAMILEARIATLERKPNWLTLWAAAVKLSDGLAYDEPDNWYYSVRTFYGAALLAAGNAKEAEAVYREDLARNPNNGWSLFGLWKSLEAQKKTSEAKQTKATFDNAWANADVKLTASAF